MQSKLNYFCMLRVLQHRKDTFIQEHSYRKVGKQLKLTESTSSRFILRVQVQVIRVQVIRVQVRVITRQRSMEYYIIQQGVLDWQRSLARCVVPSDSKATDWSEAGDPAFPPLRLTCFFCDILYAEHYHTANLSKVCEHTHARKYFCHTDCESEQVWVWKLRLAKWSLQAENKMYVYKTKLPDTNFHLCERQDVP